MFFELQLASLAIRRQARQLTPLFEALGEIGVQLGQHFAAPALRPQHARDGDELAYSTISNS
jgi:ABC-type transporter lipoprotein component MlaA